MAAENLNPSDPEKAGKLISFGDAQEAAKAKEGNDPAKALAEDRSFRDELIERDEREYLDDEKQDETLRAETVRLKDKFLNKHAAQIEKAIKEGRGPLESREDLPGFLKECGVEEAHVNALEAAYPTETNEALEPVVVHFVDALYKTINELCEDSSFDEGQLTKRVLVIYEETRRSTFVEDDTRYALYQDRHGKGFYHTPEGRGLVYRAAAERQGGEGGDRQALAA